MQCRRCGKELGGSSRCSFCGYHNAEEGSVREMSAVERNNYRGITIDAQAHEHFDQPFSFQSDFQSNFRAARNETGIWTRLFGNHIVTRILVALVLVMLLAVTLFIALPLVVTLVVTLVVWYFVKRALGRR